jgi:hypothetical protein
MTFGIATEANSDFQQHECDDEQVKSKEQFSKQPLRHMSRYYMRIGLRK